MLPFLWFVNVVWFFREAFIKPAFTGQPKLKSCKYTRFLHVYLKIPIHVALYKPDYVGI